MLRLQVCNINRHAISRMHYEIRSGHIIAMSVYLVRDEIMMQDTALSGCRESFREYCWPLLCECNPPYSRE
jgi:hypothetical protein